MSQKATRKSQNTPVADEKEKAETPVKEMKKKIAANAEKDKQAAEKAEKSTDKNEAADKSKSTEKADKNKPAEKGDKNSEKPDKTDKNADKSDKNADKPDKNAEKVDKTTEKKPDKSDKADKKPDKAADKKADKSAEKKSEQAEKNESKGDSSKDKGRMNGHNGAANGDSHASDASDCELVIEDDEVFPELAYDDSDSDADDAPARSITRREQVKATKTPETPAPRPASDDSKVLKLSEAVAPSDRKLRSADSPKPDAKKKESAKTLDLVLEEEKKATKKDLEAPKKDAVESKDGADKSVDVEVVAVESSEGAGRSRARVSPFSRPALDRTASSVMADYSGNNSTMEMDITESSSIMEEADSSGYLRGLRGVRGRASYKLLRDIALTNPNAGRPRPAPGPASLPLRPTGAVVGRKRKPSSESEAALEAEAALAAHGKRMRLLHRLAALPRRAAEIVGINSDLPLAAPVLPEPAFDPESMKPAPPARPAPGEPLATPLPRAAAADRRCVVM